MAIDPGFKSGCKLVCLDEQGALLHNETIYPHPPQSDSKGAMKKITSLINSFRIDAIAIGNGTKAEGEGSIAMGINNTVEPNALFTIGKGPVNTSSGNAMVIYKTGKSTFYEDMTVNKWLTVKDLFIAEDGMVLTGEINRGGTDDMIPIAYGSVSSTGAIYASGGSFEVTKNAAHTYTITVADPNTNVDLALSHSNSATTVSTISGQFRTSSISHSNGSVRVHIFDSSFGQVANSFQFVIYKQ